MEYHEIWNVDEHMAYGNLAGWKNADFPMRARWRKADLLGSWAHLRLLWDRCPQWYALESPHIGDVNAFMQTVNAAKMGLIAPQWTRAGLDAAMRLGNYQEHIHNKADPK